MTKSYISRFFVSTIKIVVLLLCCNVLNEAFAQQTVVIMREKTGFFDDSFNYSGSGGKFDINIINGYWNEGKQITSVSYGGSGWFVTAAKNTKYTTQQCLYEDKWNVDWINNAYKSGYYITSVAYGEGHWLIIMSLGSGFTNQVYFHGNTTSIETNVKKYWNHDFRITAMCPYGEQWFVVMSKNSNLGKQTYTFEKSFESVEKFIKNKYAEPYRVTGWSTNTKSNTHFLVMSQFADGSVPGEFCIDEYLDPQNFIKDGWKDKLTIVTTGGGRNTISTTATKPIDRHIALNGNNSTKTPTKKSSTATASKSNEPGIIYQGYYTYSGYYFVDSTPYTQSSGTPVYMTLYKDYLTVKYNNGTIEKFQRINDNSGAYVYQKDPNNKNSIRYIFKSDFRLLTKYTMTTNAGMFNISSTITSHYDKGKIQNNNSSSPAPGYNQNSYQQDNRRYQTETYYDTCPHCNGMKRCPTCLGRGYYYNSYSPNNTLACPNCDSNHNGLCNVCHGTGTVAKTRSVYK